MLYTTFLHVLFEHRWRICSIRSHLVLELIVQFRVLLWITVLHIISFFYTEQYFRPCSDITVAYSNGRNRKRRSVHSKFFSSVQNDVYSYYHQFWHNMVSLRSHNGAPYVLHFSVCCEVCLDARLFYWSFILRSRKYSIQCTS